jgi:DNA-binding HxlR family transcriptional regulator
MPADGGENCTSQVPDINEVVDLVSRRGIVAILTGLSTGPLRHNQLGRRTGLDNKQLSRALRSAESAGLVIRRVRGRARPVEVVYDLTVRGVGLVRALHTLAHAWGRESDSSDRGPAAWRPHEPLSISVQAPSA